MSIQISEIRLDEWSAVLAMFRDGEGLEENSHALRLVARRGEDILAAIVCTPTLEGYRCQMARPADQSDADAEKLLIDKALFKLNSHQVRKCRIEMDEAFFTAVRWPPSPIDAASMSSVNDVETQEHRMAG